MDLEENLKFIKKDGAELADEKYIFVGCNTSHVVAVSMNRVTLYCRLSLKATRRLRAKRNVVAADLHRNVLVLVSHGEMHAVCTESLRCASFSVPGIMNVSISDMHLLVQKGSTVLVFVRDTDGVFSFKSSVDNALRIGKDLVVCGDQVLYMLAPEGQISAQNKGDVLGVVGCSNRIVVTNTHFVTKDKAIAHSMGDDVLWTTFDVFTVFIRKGDTMFVLVGEDELELDEDATMVRCRQEGGNPMGVLFLFSTDDRLYFLDSGSYLSVYVVEGAEIKKEEEGGAPLPAFDIGHPGAAVSKQAAGFEAIFEEQDAAVPSAEEQRVKQRDPESEPRDAAIPENRNMEAESPPHAVSQSLKEIVDKVRDIRIRGHHIKMFKYYESTDLYEKNAELYEKIQKAAAIINDIESGTFEKNLLSDIETIRYRALETTRVEKSMIQANILYIDSKILGRAGFRRPVHYTSPLVARNTYAMHYEDLPPLRQREKEECGLLDIFETMSFGRSDERSVVDLQNLDITGLSVGPEQVAESLFDGEASAVSAHENAREDVFMAPPSGSVEAAPEPEAPVVQMQGGGEQNTMHSIFGQSAEGNNVFGGSFQGSGDAVFRPETTSFPGLQSTTNLFSQAVQSGPLEAPSVATWPAKDEKKNKSALSKLSSQMGNFFGNQQ